VFTERLELRLLLASLELDLTFGRGGYAPLPESGELHALQQLPDGKIIAAGDMSSGPVVARFNADGSRDTTFDGDGVLVIESPGSVDDAAFGFDGKRRRDRRRRLRRARHRARPRRQRQRRHHGQPVAQPPLRQRRRRHPQRRCRR
jgi:hypothetical protein